MPCAGRYKGRSRDSSPDHKRETDMKFRAGRIVFGAVVALALLLPAAAVAQPLIQPGPCVDGDLPHGAKSKICVPVTGWNGQLVLDAHGYVDVYQPKDFYHLDFGVVNLPFLVQSQGFAFATTTYRQNGLAILEGRTTCSTSSRVHRPGMARRCGPLLPAHPKAAGRHAPARAVSELFSSGLAACAPVGSFRGQVNYVGDFRVLFDYFFRNTVPGTVDNVPPDVVPNWLTYTAPRSLRSFRPTPRRARADAHVRRGLRSRQPGHDRTNDPDVLYYNVFGGTDAEIKLGGNPYGNRLRWYSGSSNDLRLTVRVGRYSASPTALAVITQYQTSGHLTRPLVTLHTRGDEVIPFAARAALPGEGSADRAQRAAAAAGRPIRPLQLHPERTADGVRINRGGRRVLSRFVPACRIPA